MRKEIKRYNNRLMGIANGAFAALLFGFLVWRAIISHKIPDREDIDLASDAILLLPIIFLAFLASLIFFLKNTKLSSNSKKK
ncbi:MAG: hypothetical protein WC831_00570 [Parcubacteria group bacterium]|jgi:cytochrome c oxidase assembly factor CtaG